MVFFSIFNLNIMHGRNRKSAVFPPRLSRHEIESNLQNMVDNIHEHSPDIVTLQEVDQSSVLSGSFNQFEFLNEKLRYPYKYFAPSCSIVLFGKSIFVSGNAIFSRFPLEHCESYNFDFSFPTERKGFIIADVRLPQGKTVTIASVHVVWIDWMRPNSQSRQLDIIRRVIAARRKSIVLAGDFNCDFLGRETSLRPFVNQLGLNTYEPESDDLNTYPSWNPYERTDWILTSKDFQFVSHETTQTKLSDHLAVLATLSFRE